VTDFPKERSWSAAELRGIADSGDHEAFGSRLRAGRLAAGLSQEELADRSGVSVRAISDLERGRTRWPHPNSVDRLADALDLDDAPRAELVALADRRLAQQAIPPPAVAGSTAAVNGQDPRAGSRSAPEVRYSLPPHTTAFTGRRAELERVPPRSPAPRSRAGQCRSA
jgi:transcriptional regulator with XRE-family HTH domain